MTTVTKSKAEQVAKELESIVNTVLLATARAQLIREKVDAIGRKLLAEKDYYSRYKDHPRLKNATGEQEPIRDPQRAWVLGEDEWKEWHEKLVELRNADETIPKPSKPENCPALEAENLQMQAEHCLFDRAGEVIEGLAGVRARLYGDNRAKMLDLLIKLVVNAPGYVPVKVPTQA